MNNQEWQYGEGNEYLSLDFSRCQRPDGTYYGTGGQCRKGIQAPPKEKNPAKGRKPVDSAMLGKMSDKQLATLMGRKELDTDQKAAIAKELQDRRNAAIEGEKSGNAARTAAAQEGIDKFKKEQEDQLNPKGEVDPELSKADRRAMLREISDGFPPNHLYTGDDELFGDADRVALQWDNDVLSIVQARFGGEKNQSEAVEKMISEGGDEKFYKVVGNYFSNTYGGKWTGMRRDYAADAVLQEITFQADQMIPYGGTYDVIMNML